MLTLGSCRIIFIVEFLFDSFVILVMQQSVFVVAIVGAGGDVVECSSRVFFLLWNCKRGKGCASRPMSDHSHKVPSFAQLDWLHYFNTLLATVNLSVTVNEPVVVVAPLFLEQLTPLVNATLSRPNGRR